MRAMNWPTLIADIQRHGKMTQPQIAEHCHCAQATVSDLASGVTANPRYALGAALTELHAAVMATVPAPQEG